jgi:ABC-type uncharacterized transport system fused permease/ATPase subunit
MVSRLSTYAEQIAALKGGSNEENNILKSWRNLLNYATKYAQFRCNMSFIDSVVARCVGSILNVECGFVTLSHISDIGL